MRAGNPGASPGQTALYGQPQKRVNIGPGHRYDHKPLLPKHLTITSISTEQFPARIPRTGSLPAMTSGPRQHPRRLNQSNPYSTNPIQPKHPKRPQNTQTQQQQNHQTHSTNAQCPPFAGPARPGTPSSRSIRTCFSTVLCVRWTPLSRPKNEFY